MDEKNLLKVALICSIIGIFIIFVFANRLEPSLINISEISSSLVDQSVKVQGKIVSIKNSPSVLIFDVKDDTGSVKVVVFDKKNLDLNKNQLVEVLGVVKEYKGSLEVEAKNIKAV